MLSNFKKGILTVALLLIGVVVWGNGVSAAGVYYYGTSTTPLGNTYYNWYGMGATTGVDYSGGTSKYDLGTPTYYYGKNYPGTPTSITVYSGVTYLTTTEGIYKYVPLTTPNSNTYYSWEPVAYTSATDYSGGTSKYDLGTPTTYTGTNYTGMPTGISIYNGTIYITTTEGVFQYVALTSPQSNTYYGFSPITNSSAYMGKYGEVAGGKNYEGRPNSISVCDGIIYITTTTGVYKYVTTPANSWEPIAYSSTTYYEGGTSKYDLGTPVTITGSNYAGTPKVINVYKYTNPNDNSVTITTYLATTGGFYKYTTKTASGGSTYYSWDPIASTTGTDYVGGSKYVAGTPTNYPGSNYSGTPTSINIYNNVIYVTTTAGVYTYATKTTPLGATYYSWDGIGATTGTDYSGGSGKYDLGTPTYYYGSNYSGAPKSIDANSGMPIIATLDPPTAVTLTAESTGFRTIKLTWTGGVGAFDFEVFRDGVSLGYKTSGWEDTRLKNGTTYSYFIKAINDAGSPQSNTATATTPPDTVAPAGTMSINSGAAYTNTSPLLLTFNTSDNTTYPEEMKVFVSDKNIAPAAGTAGWRDNGQIQWTYADKDAKITLYAWFKDISDNISAVAIDDITFDKTPITGSMSITNGEGTVNLKFIKKYDPAVDFANVNRIIISNYADFTRYESVSYSELVKNWTVLNSSVAGLKTVYAKYLDWAGNYGPAFSSTVQYKPSNTIKDVVDNFDMYTGYVDEQLTKLDGSYTYAGKYETESSLYFIFTATDGSKKVVDWQGNIMEPDRAAEINPQPAPTNPWTMEEDDEYLYVYYGSNRYRVNRRSSNTDYGSTEMIYGDNNFVICYYNERLNGYVYESEMMLIDTAGVKRWRLSFGLAYTWNQVLIDRETNTMYLFYTSEGWDQDVKMLPIDLVTGKTGPVALRFPTFKFYENYAPMAIKSNNTYFVRNNVLYRRAFKINSGQSTTNTSGSGNGVITVAKGCEFKVAVAGDYIGNYGDFAFKKDDWVLATPSDTKPGYSIITGNFMNLPADTSGIVTIAIEDKEMVFRVIDPPQITVTEVKFGQK